MSEPIWLDVEILIDLHAEQLAPFGGPDGIRDEGMLESALDRPINKWHLWSKLTLRLSPLHMPLASLETTHLSTGTSAQPLAR